MKKKDILFSIVTIVLLSLFTGIVITGVVRNESFFLLICFVAGLLFSITLVYFIFHLIEEKLNFENRMKKYQILDKIFDKIHFPEDKSEDAETVITERKPNGDKESIITTKKRNLNADLCKKWLDVAADL